MLVITGGRFWMYTYVETRDHQCSLSLTNWIRHRLIHSTAQTRHPWDTLQIRSIPPRSFESALPVIYRRYAHPSSNNRIELSRKLLKLYKKKSARFARTFSSIASRARMSAPRARDLVIVALRGPTHVNFALRAYCSALCSA